MKDTANLFKLFSDVTRLRILMLLSRAELCVCQIMGVLGVSQPLVSRNLSLLSNAGLLGERRDGKLMFYCVRPDLGEPHVTLMRVIASELRSDELFSLDLASLSDCQDFQKKTGKCDMKTFQEFMRRQREQAERTRAKAKAS